MSLLETKSPVTALLSLVTDSTAVESSAGQFSQNSKMVRFGLYTRVARCQQTGRQGWSQ